MQSRLWPPCPANENFSAGRRALTDISRNPGNDDPVHGRHRRPWIAVIAGLYLVLASIFATTPLDIDEFTFVREPYEMLGGDYTMGYVRRHEYVKALKTVAKSYYLFWYYRPLNAPVIGDSFRSMFKNEEADFGYVRPDSIKFSDPAAIEKYKARLIVPEPDRFYSHGAGKPLLPALLSMPQLAVARGLGITGDEILDAQYRGRSSPIFLILRLAQLIAGLASVLLLFRILEKGFSSQRACLGALIFAIFPVVIKYFPNLHQDSILVPFVLLAVYMQMGGRYAAAGGAYGLALASKNLAIVVAPALVVDLMIRSVAVWKENGVQPALAFLRPQLAGLALMAAVAFVTFLPFANPVTYAEEIMTPVISRPIDPRGENVNQWTVTGIVGDKSQVSPQVAFAQRFLYFNDLGFMFFVLAIGLAFQRKLTSLGRLAIAIIVIYLPLSSIFGLALTYRTLLLVPFFAIAVAELLEVMQLRWLAVAISILAMIYVSDPGRTDLIHNKQEIRSPRQK